MLEPVDLPCRSCKRSCTNGVESPYVRYAPRFVDTVQQWLQESLGEFCLKGLIVVTTLSSACLPIEQTIVRGESDDLNRSLTGESGLEARVFR